MSDEYDDLRFNLDDVGGRFEKLAKENADLRHLVCHSGLECLGEATWTAFIRRYSHLPDGKWHEWNVLNGGMWCGRMYGTGSFKPEFVGLVEEAVSVLERLSKLDGVGEAFFVTMPQYPPCDAWLSLLYDTGELLGTPESTLGWWGVQPEHNAPLEFDAYWSRPDAEGVSYPLHPTCLSLKSDLFTASAQMLDHILEPTFWIDEYRGIAGFADEYWVPPYLPEEPWEALEIEKALEAVKKREELTTLGNIGGDEQALRPVWDENRRELRLGNQLVKRFKLPSIRQEVLPQGFQKAGWPEKIPNPFLHVTGEMEPKDLLLSTTYDWNRFQKLRQSARVFFNCDGKGNVGWSVGGSPSSSD